jgi:hypothetical protein
MHQLVLSLLEDVFRVRVKGGVGKDGPWFYCMTAFMRGKIPVFV